MEPEFWHERWQKKQTAFHLDQVNPVLQKYYPRLKLSDGDRVFVPLCGASHDLPWLVEQGHDVVGVELSEVAVAQLFEEHSLTPTCEPVGSGGVTSALTRWQSGNLTVFQGDLFALTAQLVGNITAVYDRAALIALPESLRRRYIDHLNSIMSMQRRTLLITLEYDPAVMNGPPFSVNEDDVKAYFVSDFAIEKLSDMDIIDKSASFQERGHQWIREPVYLIQPG